MTVIIYAILTTLALIGVIELGKFKTKPIAALILTAIAFIYVGFAGNEVTALTIAGIQGSVFLLIAYLGLRRNSLFLPIGLVLHALWDILYLYAFQNDHTPAEYEWYCVCVDSGLAVYFYWKLSSKKSLI